MPIILFESIATPILKLVSKVIITENVKLDFSCSVYF